MEIQGEGNNYSYWCRAINHCCRRCLANIHYYFVQLQRKGRQLTMIRSTGYKMTDEDLVKTALEILEEVKFH